MYLFQFRLCMSVHVRTPCKTLRNSIKKEDKQILSGANMRSYAKIMYQLIPRGPTTPPRATPRAFEFLQKKLSNPLLCGRATKSNDPLSGHGKIVKSSPWACQLC